MHCDGTRVLPVGAEESLLENFRTAPSLTSVKGYYALTARLTDSHLASLAKGDRQNLRADYGDDGVVFFWSTE